MNRHLKILEFALSTLLRHKIKNLMVVVVYTFVVFILASVLFFSQALKKEATLLFDQTPELIVQRVSAGRHGSIQAFPHASSGAEPSVARPAATSGM
jgi:hypothetical protein